MTNVLHDGGDPLRASDVVAGLTPPERCAHVETLARIEPTYGSAQARTFAREQAQAIEHVRSLRAAGKLVEAKEAAEAVVREADALGDPAVRASALVALGQTLSMLREPRPAEKVLREGVWAAEASGHVEAAADGWIELINVVGILSERYDEGRQAAERGAAAVHRLGSPTHAMQLAGNRAVVASLAGDYEGALKDQREVLQQAIELHGPRDTQVARVHMNIAAALNHLGRLDEALEHALTGLEIQRVAHPGPHPATCQMLNSVGVLELQLGRFEDAREHLDLGIAIAGETLPEGNATTATLEATRAHLYLRDGDFAAAEAGMRRTIEIYERVNGREHPDVALATHNLASVIDKAGDKQRAIETYRQALELRLATVGPDHPGTAGTLHNLGLTLFDSGVDVKEGIELLERAKAIRDAQKVDPYKRATTRFMLARAYLDQGRREEAFRHAEEAREFLALVAPLHADVAEHIDAWLAKYRDGEGPPPASP